ncbi:hypothetical protein NFI96_016943 [Prochilodus magdalenae]|nr:hypothetical protein NFI96_016943 [Prochilodus magdalenae]
MNRFLVLVALTGLLSSGTESFRISETEYENIDRMLQFGVNVFLNCLDKVKEATEKLVKDDMLRTNRIAIQTQWNSFRDTANKISIEERGKGEMDGFVVAARTVRRLVQHYKDDVKGMLHSLTKEQYLHLYLPVVNMFKGTIERAKAKEIWDTLVTNYLPDAPPIESEPLEFLCYLLSTSAVETLFVDSLKFSMDVISKVQKINFDEVSERVRSTSLLVLRKFNEIEKIEREKESDELLLTISVASRVIVFYWDRFLNLTDTPELQEKYTVIRSQVEDNYLLVLYNLLTPVMEWETVKEVWEHYMDFCHEFFLIGLGILRNIYYYAGEERCSRTVRAVGMNAVISAYPIYERLSEKGVFGEMEKLYLRTVNISIALIGNEEVEHFR